MITFWALGNQLVFTIICSILWSLDHSFQHFFLLVSDVYLWFLAKNPPSLMDSVNDCSVHLSQQSFNNRHKKACRSLQKHNHIMTHLTITLTYDYNLGSINGHKSRTICIQLLSSGCSEFMFLPRLSLLTTLLLAFQLEHVFLG